MYSYLQLYIPDEIDEPRDFTHKNYEFIAYGIGGKLRNVYHPDKDGEYRPTGPRAGNEAYEATPTSIQGFIRRVADGRKPSQETEVANEKRSHCCPNNGCVFQMWYEVPAFRYGDCQGYLGYTISHIEGHTLDKKRDNR